MKPERFAQLKKLLLEVSDLPENERQSYLDQACGDDPELRSEAETILADGAESSAILQQAGDIPDAAVSHDPATQPIPTGIAGYKIKRIIGQGGMGVVYEAEQEKPRRTVALKVLRSGIASATILRRFEYESQLLARLTHPGIAQVFEAGTHDDGIGAVPYFAMEYVPDARSIIDYAKEKKLGTRERLELITQVCDAVHHGHQKGIIHRDLKPGNILVNPEGLVKIIDFGVACSTDSDMALTTMQTDVGQLIGTLQYMSPEQCAADPNNIDTRSDVYALGVVQYELLYGQLPYDVRQKAFHEVTRVIREEPPTRPSSISKQLRGDVETITLKALEKERDRRYQSAVELGQDIRRYLSGEAIVGRPASIVYQMHIFARRHKMIFGALTAIFIVLAVGLAVSSAMYFRAEQAREETANERDRALASEAGAEAVTAFLSDRLAAVGPTEAQGREMTLKGMLDKTAIDIDTAFPGQPLREATLRATIGNTYRALGEYSTAEPHLERALELRRRELGEDHQDTLVSMNDLAVLYRRQSRHVEVEPLYQRSLELSRRVLGEDHPDTLIVMSELAALYRDQGRFDEAEPLHLETLELRRRSLGEDDPDTLTSMSNLALLYSEQGRYEEAEPLTVAVLDLYRRKLGEMYPDTLVAMNNLGLLYKKQGRYDEAEPLYLRTLELCRQVQGEDHHHTLIYQHNLALLYDEQGKWQDAESIYVKTLESFRRVLGEEHQHTLIIMHNLANLYQKQGRYAEAESLHSNTLLLRRRLLGEQHPETLSSLCSLVTILIDQKKLQGAEPLALECYETNRRVNGPKSTETEESIKLLIRLYDTWSKREAVATWQARLINGESEIETRIDQ